MDSLLEILQLKIRSKRKGRRERRMMRQWDLIIPEDSSKGTKRRRAKRIRRVEGSLLGLNPHRADLKSKIRN